MDTRSVSSGGWASGGSSYNSSNQRGKVLDKLFSKKNLGVNSMPVFIHGNIGITKIRIPKERSSSPEASSPAPLHLNESYVNLKRQRSMAIETTSRKLSYSPTYQDDLIEFTNLIREENAKKEVMRVWNFILTAEDFLSLVDPGPISRKGIDACLGSLKKKNTETLKEKDEGKRVVIVSTSFAWKIFNLAQYEDLHASIYIMTYDLIIFPIFIGYWALLVVDIKECKVSFYDIGNSGKYLESILVNCFRFLQQEIHFHNGPHKHLEEIKALRYENHQDHSDISINDSSTYILFKVNELALMSECDEEINIMDFKEYLAKLIFKDCERID
ncbi:hypothetical protein SteCoe_4759 [Stentor coeruleus]|uniref:Ubiquitin-like protease family profile domain-containing protein n=1 Tax=Stentor coeruleus TaxID=5963 RepID=A0A1R2CU11_9CILI|nr:hypothetical protein SteCoe_4759 [Stentor coeruleus]